MLLEAAIGDAYGAAFEYVDAAVVLQHNDLQGYYGHPRHNIGKGKYTDDTEMSTAVAEAMLQAVDDGMPLSREMLADWFVKAFHREQREGYAHGFYGFLKTRTCGADFLTGIQPDSEKSGAAMRGWIIGLYPTPELVMAMADLQARITHNTPGGIRAAQAAALMTHYFVYQLGPKAGMIDFVAKYVPAPWANPWVRPVGSAGLDSTHAAIQAVATHDSMSAILRQCIDYTGDVDTVATIALGAASMATDVTQNLPQVLIDNLEQGEWGTAYLKELDWRLYQWCERQP